jgi:hypothetical protein
MRKALIAEWVLRRVTTRERAAAIVGDLVEADLPEGSGRFWFSVAGVVISQSSRWALALVVACYVAPRAYGFVEIQPFNSHHLAPEGWIKPLNMACGIATILWFITPYAAIRYGLRDNTVRLSFASAGLITTIGFFWWQPWVLAVCGIVCLAGAMFWLSQVEWRNAVLVAAITIMLGFLAAFLMFYLDFLYQNFIVPGGVMGGREFLPSMRSVDGLLVLMAVATTTKAFSLAHDWLVPGTQIGSDSERASVIENGR